MVRMTVETGLMKHNAQVSKDYVISVCLAVCLSVMFYGMNVLLLTRVSIYVSIYVPFVNVTPCTLLCNYE